MTRNSPSIPGGNLDAVTFPTTATDGFDTGDLPPFCPDCGGDGENHFIGSDHEEGKGKCPTCNGTGWDESDPAFEPVEPAHVAADFEAGYGPYDRDED